MSQRAINNLLALLHLILTALLAATSPSPVGAQAARTWNPAGFGGAGNFIGVHFDPSQPGVVYATSDVAGVLRSTDYGDHWEIRSLGLGNHEIASFAVDPFDSNTLYAGVGAFPESNKAGIYVSHDAGLTWQHLASTFTNRITFRRFRTADAIAPDPANRGVLLSGSRDNGIWRSTDGGLSWTQVFQAPLTNAPLTTVEVGLALDDPTTTPYPAPVSVVIFDPAGAKVVYAGLDGAGVIQSTAGGVAGSWQAINTGLPAEAKVKDIAIGSGVLYAAVDTNGIYKSTGGGQWQPVNGSLPLTNAWVSSVTVHPTNADIAHLTLVTYDYPSVWKTTDGGANWSAKADWENPGEVVVDTTNNPSRGWATGPTLSWMVRLDRNNPNRLFFVDFWGIVRSDDGGERWADKIAGAQNTCVTSLLLDTAHPAGQPDTLYATHMDAGLLSSTDNGTTWTMLQPPPGPFDDTLSGHYWRFAVARSGATKYYYATSDPDGLSYSQVLRSTDGVNWTRVFRPARPAGRWMSGAMLGLAVDPGSPSTLYVTQDGGQVFKSTDNGDTWAPTPGQPGGNSFTYALVADEAGRVFAGTLEEGLWRSNDGGASWQRVMNEIRRQLSLPGWREPESW